MNFTKSIPVLALLATTLNAVMLDANAQPFADSAGASSQRRGELVSTPAGIVPAAASADATSDSATVAALGEIARPVRADSTGGSSVTRWARVIVAPVDALRDHGPSLASK